MSWVEANHKDSEPVRLSGLTLVIDEYAFLIKQFSIK